MKHLRLSDDLDLPIDWMTMATVAYGSRGSGKTTLGAVVAEELHACGQRFCAIDLKGDLWGLRASADGKSAGIPVVIFGGDHGDLPLEPEAGKFMGEPLLVIADEAQRYTPQKSFSPEASICLGAVEDLVKLGRKHGLGVLLLTQRGAGLNKEVSEICDMVVAFRSPGSIDQERVRDWLSHNGFLPKGARDPMEGIAKFADGQALVASAHPSLSVFNRVQMRRRWTFDSSATPKVGERRRDPKILAAPDLAALKVEMALAVERAKESDPSALRSKVKELQAALYKAQQLRAPAMVQVDVEKIVEVDKIVEVPMLTEKDVARFEAAASRIQKVIDKQIAELAPLQERLATATATIRSKMEQAMAQVKQARATTARVARPAPPSNSAPSGALDALAEVAPPRSVVSEGLTGPQQRMLDMLASFAAAGAEPLDPRNLAVVSDQSPRSSGYRNNLSRLATLLLVDRCPGGVRLTDAGRHKAVVHPVTQSMLLMWWAAKLSGPQGRMMMLAVHSHPAPVDWEEMASATDQSPKSSGYRNNHSTLRGLGVLEHADRPKAVRAGALLYPEGLRS